jgi:transcriptional regulator with XRE-family HTH domain
MILIHDGYMIDPKSGREGNYDILIDGDKIVKIAEKIEPRGKVTRINAEGLLVAPGLVDVHVHFRDPGFTAKEDINTGAAAAAKGGVTTVVLMANTKPAVDSEETLHYILDKGAKTGIHVTTCANVTMGMQGKQLTDMKKLAVAGAVGFTDDGVPLLDAELVRRAMEISAELDMPISFHEEDPKYIENNGVNRGKASEYYGIGGSAREAEIALVENLQREDLDPVEEAMGIRELMTRCDLTQEQAARKLGKSRSALANSLRLLNLPENVLELLKSGFINTGHAKVILGLPTPELQEQAAQMIADHELNVRQAEVLCKKLARPAKGPAEPAPIDTLPVEVEESLKEVLGSEVNVAYHGGKGRLTVHFYSDEQLRAFANLLGQYQQSCD